MNNDAKLTLDDRGQWRAACEAVHLLLAFDANPPLLIAKSVLFPGVVSPIVPCRVTGFAIPLQFLRAQSQAANLGEICLTLLIED